MAAAEQARGRYVRLADRAARFYAPAVHVLGLATFLGWLATGHGWESGADRGHRRADHHLPLRAGARRAGGAGRRQPAGCSARACSIKAPDGLERLAEIDTVVFDKTGTLTLGEPSLGRERTSATTCSPRAARLAAASRHPYARAVVRAAEAAGLAVRPAGRRARGAGRRAWSASVPTAASGWARPPGAAPTRRAADTATVCYRPARGSPVALRLRGPAAARCGRGRRERCSRRASAPSSCPATARRGRGRRIRRRHRALAWPRAAAGRQDRPPRGAEGRRPQGADGRRRPQRRAALAAAHASLSPSSAADISQTAADAVFQGETPRPGAGDARRRPRRAPHGAAELRHRHRLQCRVRAAGHGGPRDAADRRDRHVGLLDRRHRQRRPAQDHAPGAGMR